VTGRAGPLVESAFLAAVLAVLALMARFQPVPGVSAVIGWVEPLPVVLAFVRHGRRWGVLTATVAGLFLLLALGPLSGALLAIRVGAVGLVLGWAERRRLGLAAAVLATFGAMLSYSALAIAALSLFLGRDLFGFTPVYRLFDWLVARWPGGAGGPLQPLRHLVPVVAGGAFVAAVAASAAATAVAARLAVRRLGDQGPGAGPPKT
jgi:hypothetical protein